MDNGNNNNEKKNQEELKDKIKKVTQKEGFYLVLFLCVCIVGVTAVWVSGDNFNQMSKLDEEKAEDDILDYYPEDEVEEEPLIEEPEIAEEPEPPKEEPKKQAKEEPKKEVKPEPKEEPKHQAQAPKKEEPKQEAKKEEAVEASANARRAKAMLVPIMGKQSMGFADDNLVYSETLEQWTTHNGLDIKADKGSSVRAVLKGVVKEVKKTDDLGQVVTIDHGNGLVTKYGSLSEKVLVKKGQNINKGDAIGSIGTASGYEVEQGPHLHFEVLENEKNIDPKEYIPDFE